MIMIDLYITDLTAITSTRICSSEVAMSTADVLAQDSVCSE